MTPDRVDLEAVKRELEEADTVSGEEQLGIWAERWGFILLAEVAALRAALAASRPLEHEKIIGPYSNCETDDSEERARNRRMAERCKPGCKGCESKRLRKAAGYE